MSVSNARLASVLVCTAIVALPALALAQEQAHAKKGLSDYVRHLAFAYERLPLSVGDTTFSVDGSPDLEGKELGFSSPIAHVLDVRWEFDVARKYVVVLDTYMGGWAKRDTAATDPYASHVSGDIVVGGGGLGLGDTWRLGDHLVVRGDVTLGLQLSQIPLSPHPSRGNSGINAFQIFVRPRVAFEVSLSETLALGAFVSDDAVRPKLVALGGYLGVTLW